MNLYQVIIDVGAPMGSEGFDVDADGYRFERPEVEGCAPFIVFYRDLPLVLDPLAPAHAPDPDNPANCICGWEGELGRPATRALDMHISAANEPLLPALQANGEELLFAADPRGGPVPATATLEVFRAPVHALLAVRLVDDDEDEEEEPEVRP